MSDRMPGWYEHPDAPDALRYFDGTQWTNRLKPVEERQRPVETWRIAIGVTVGILLAALVIGLIVGIVREENRSDCLRVTTDC